MATLVFAASRRHRHSILRRAMATFRDTSFSKYYLTQQVFRDDELDAVIATLRRPLPSCFRINPNAPNRASIHDALQTQFQFETGSITFKDQPVSPPQPLAWFPAASGSAWQIECGKAVISKLGRGNELFGALHKFLMLHTASGAITRQEAVSMIPTLFLDVQPGQRVLDMCAAPGSKTSQILETLTSSPDQLDGFVVANDASEKRGFMLVHQLLRLGLLSAVVTCHHGQHFPGLYDPVTRHLQTTNAFDRVLCDVPCTGDSTLRKNENIWRQWHVGDGLTLHPFQLEIALRGAALLKVGGTMVYSTCSFNPIENEAVVAELIRRSDGALRLVDASLPGLKHRPGLTSWQVGWQSKTKAKKQRHQPTDQPKDESMAWYASFSEDIPADLRGYRLTRSMFPPDDNEAVHLERCLRFLPHDQNTGGFFVAVLEKVAPLPGVDQQGLPAFEVTSELGPKCYRYVCRLCNQTGHLIQDCALSKKSLEKAATAAVSGHDSAESATSTETPLVVDTDEATGDVASVDDGALMPLPPSVWSALQDFYGLPPTFPHERLFARSHGTGIVTYVSSSVQAACLAGPDLKVINTGVKVFMKFSTSHFKGYRPAQDGLDLLIPFLGNRKVSVGWAAFHDIVAITTTKFFDELDESTKQKFHGMDVGPAVVVLQRQGATSNDDLPPVGVAIWVGHTSLSKLVTTSDLSILADHLRSVDESVYEP